VTREEIQDICWGLFFGTLLVTIMIMLAACTERDPLNEQQVKACVLACADTGIAEIHTGFYSECKCKAK
jgi:hypothetical protein